MVAINRDKPGFIMGELGIEEDIISALQQHGKLTAAELFDKFTPTAESPVDVARAIAALLSSRLIADCGFGFNGKKAYSIAGMDQQPATSNAPELSQSHSAPTEHPPLLDHQDDAVEATLEAFRESDRAKIVMACGTGKTRIAVEVAIRLNSNRVIVFLPSLALIRQTLPYWLNASFSKPMSYLCVCSDKTVNQSEDGVVLSNKEFAEEFGSSSVTTDAAKVNLFLRDTPDSENVLVVFSTYQSANIVSTACDGMTGFDLGIFDEAHRTAGGGGEFSAALHDKNIPIRKRAFFTATPKHVSARSSDVVYSMDDDQIYGNTAFKLPMREAINRGLISDYKLIVSVIDEAEIKNELAKSGIPYITEEVRNYASAISLKKAKENYSVRKILTFHSSIAFAKYFAESEFMQKVVGGSIYHVNGALKSIDRKTIMTEFAEKDEALITNARCLTEGVDVPQIDMIAFLSPKESKIDIIQALGRTLRKCAGKHIGYVLLPIYVSDTSDETIQQSIFSGCLATVVDVIQALRENDEAIDSYVRRNSPQKGTPKCSDASEIHKFVEFITPHINSEAIEKAITNHCLDIFADDWEKSFSRLVEYKEKHGNASPIVLYLSEDGFPLGSWCSRQRVRYKKGVLHETKIERLNSIGFQWEILDAAFNRTFDLIVEYKEKFGNAYVPVPYVTENNFKLGAACDSLRSSYKSGTLHPQRIKLLDDIGFVWSLHGAREDRAVNALIKFKEVHGHLQVADKYTTEDNFKLGKWCARKRTERRTGKIKAEQIPRLDAIGFMWEAQKKPKGQSVSRLTLNNT